MERLPYENIVYFGDTARVPYGVKSVETITHFTTQIAQFLLEQDVKLLVIACNTMAAVAAQVVKDLSPVPVLDVKPIAVAPHGPATVKIEPLAPMRLGSAFEALRDVSDRQLAKSGSRPKIFLANLGPIAAFTARAMYAKNFFEAGGIEALSNDGFPSQDEMVAAFKASGAKLAILCSSDELYATEAVKAAQALKAAGATYIYLAGRPGELEAAVTAAGVQGFIFMGCDLLKILQAAHGILGLK